MKKGKTINKRKKIIRIILISLILVLFLLTFNSFIRYFILFIFIAINFLFAFAKRFSHNLGVSKYLFGLELVLFSTVITSISFGSIFGALMGALLMALNYIGERRFSKYFPITLVLYTFIGYSAYFFRGYNVVLLGIIITLIYNFLVTLIVSFFEANKITMIVFNAVNIFFNTFLFILWGEFVLNLLL